MSQEELKKLKPIMSLTVFVTMMGAGIIAPFLPLYAEKMGASGLVLGMIFAAFSLARMPILPYVGHWSDQHGRKAFIVGGLLGISVSAVLFIWATTPLTLVLIRGLQGLSAGFLLPVSMAILADVIPAGQEGRVMANYNLWFLLGWGVGPLIGGVVYDHLGVTANFILLSCLSLFAAGLVHWFAPEPKERVTTKGAPGWRDRARLVGDPRLLGPLFARCGSAAIVGCLVAFLPVLGHRLGLSSLQVGSVITTEIAVMSSLQHWAGGLADRGNRVLWVAVGQTISAVGFAFMPQAQGMAWILATAALVGAGSGLAFPALTALAISQGKQIGVGMGLTMSMMNLSFSVGIFAGTIPGGFLYDVWRLDAPFILAGALTLAGVVGLLFSARRPRE